MKKRVFIIHGWAGNPLEGWFPWLKRTLESEGFEVHVPKMPDTNHPIIKSWVSHLRKIVKKSDTNTYFIGHSIGCQAILRYVQNVREEIGGMIFVAGWFHLQNLSSAQERAIVSSWKEDTIQFKEILKKTRKCVAIFSDNDMYVPLTNAKIFREKLHAKIIIEKKKGHYSGEDGILMVPRVQKELEKIAS